MSENKHSAIRRLWVPQHLHDGWTPKRIANYWSCSVSTIYKDIAILKKEGLIP